MSCTDGVAGDFMTEKGILGTLFGAFFLWGLLSCSGVDKATRAEVDQKVSEEVPTKRPGELADRGYKAWASSSSMSSDQKKQMNEIQARTEREAIRIRNETTKTRSAMYKELASGKYDDRTINGYKSKLIKLSQDRLDVTFDSLASARKVLGPSEESRKYFEYMDTVDMMRMDGHQY